MTAEGNIKKVFNESIVEYGPDVWGFYPSTDAERGIPDWVGNVFGRFCAVEHKAPHGKTKGIQLLVHRCITLAGGFVFKVETMEELDNFHKYVRALRDSLPRQ